MLVPLGALALHAGALLPVSPLRALLVVPLALLLPGYALLRALLAPALPGDRVVRLWLACILSLAMYPLLALVLSCCGLRLTTMHVLAGLDLEHALLATIILARSVWYASRAPGDLRRVSRTDWRAPVRHLWCSASHVPRLLVPALVLLPVLAGAYALVKGTPPSPFSQLSLAGNWAHLAGSVTPSTLLQVPVVVGNHSGRRRTYRLSADVDGQVRRPTRVLTLPAGAGWSGQIAGVVPDDGCVHRVRVLLTEGSGGTRNALTLWAHGRAYGTRTCASTGAIVLIPADSGNPQPAYVPVVALALRPSTPDGPRGAHVPAQRDDPSGQPRVPTGDDAAVPGRTSDTGA